MNKIINSLFFLFFVGVLAGCAEEEIVTLRADAEPPVLLGPTTGASLILVQENATEDIEFEFTPVDFGFQAAVTYVVQMDLVGNNFADAIAIASGTSSPVRVTVSELNQRLLQKGLSPDETGEVEVRVRAEVNPQVADRISGPVALAMQPYAVQLQFPRIYLPGDHQGWDPSNEQTVIFSVNSDGVYEGYVHILTGNGEFKVNATPSWDENYGDDDNDGVLDRDGSNLSIAGDFGTFLLQVNMNDLTYQIGTRRIWGIVGDATPGGWDTDTPLAFDATENVLRLTVNLNEGELKFRADNDWGFNYGDNGLNGILNDGGDNIPVTEAGNYTVTMDWRTPGEISYTLEKNP